MNTKYIFLAVIMFVLAFGTLFFKATNKPKEIAPSQLMWDVIQPSRFMSTDQVAKMIIQNDPSLELIDVRSEKEFNDFALPNAINIPLDSLLNKNNLLYLGIPGIKAVFVSDDDIAADQAWVLTKRLGFSGTYVMKGGLNRWMETIIEPKEPTAEEPETAYEAYAFRKGASMYFTGTKSAKVETSKVSVPVQRRKKSHAVAGGC